MKQSFSDAKNWVKKIDKTFPLEQELKELLENSRKVYFVTQ